ncbi:SCO family protein [Nocardioides sp.]|uniref:SCO family protein n=1 Tax=Nocardioides sp. TaxID=35761 RepID=UPI0025F4A36B|nr:SCO family protein [Nocardioides sp.]
MLVPLVLTACGGDDEQAASLTGSPVDPPFTVSSQELVDTDGEPYSLTSDTDERLTLVFFGYTNCPDICGRVLGNLSSALTRLSEEDRDQVEVVFVTTDPARDTGEVVRDYLDRFDPSFVGVTGELADIEQVAASVAVGMGEKLPSGGYEVDAHTTTVTGIDVADEAPIFWSQETSPSEFAADIHALLEED